MGEAKTREARGAVGGAGEGTSGMADAADWRGQGETPSNAVGASNSADEPGDAPSDLEMFLAGMLSNSEGMTEELLRENGMRVPGDGDEAEPPVRERPLLPAEAQLVAERAAVEAALDAVRRANRSDRLATPELWRKEGCAPAHMDDDAFAAFALDCIDAARDGAPFEGSGMEPDLGLYPDPREEGADGCAGEEGQPPTPAEGEDPSEEGLPADGEGPNGGDESGVPAGEDVDVPLAEPAALEHVHDRLACDDIRVIEGAHDVYLYSAELMSDNFAHWAFLSQEGDDVATLVDTVREESRVYPRPMLARSLTNAPYGLALEHVYEVFEQVAASGDYPDIQRCAASNGDVYYYSTTYLSTAQAKALAQWYSVEKRMNV